MGNNETKTYDTPATFVNTKRVKGFAKNPSTGVVEVTEKDSKGRAKTTLTFGLATDKNGKEINTLNDLIAALTPYQDKQVNLAIHVEEKESNGRKFPSAFVKITEMIPRDQQTKTAYVPKTNSRTETLKGKADSIRKNFEG